MLVRFNRLESLASPAFMAALALLVLNDFALKPLLHNAVTGKLSDFAGLFALTLFVTTLWPRHRRLAAWTIAAAFTFWKTSFADPLIGSLNAISPFQFGRTVDLTDLVALPMIPLAVWAGPRMRTLPVPRALHVMLAVLAPIAFTATSRATYVVRSTLDVGPEAVVDERAVQDFFDDVADRHGLRCEPCDPIGEGRVYRKTRGKGPLNLVVNLNSAERTVFFVTTSFERDGRNGVLALASDVRAGMSERFPSLTTLEFEDGQDPGYPGGEATVFTISVLPGDISAAGSAEQAKRTLSTIVEDVVRAHGLLTDETSLVYYSGRRIGVGPEHRDLVLVSAPDSNSTLRVRVVRHTAGLEALQRAVTDDLAARLDAAFGRDSVKRDDFTR
jgi:hypothetical protein